MGCLSLSQQIGPAPQIPAIFTSPFAFSISFPPALSVNLCCHFELPMFTLPIAIPAPIPPAIFTVLNALIAAALIILPTIDLPSCPMDQTS